MDRDFLTLAIISAIVAHNIEAVDDMMRAMAQINPRWADQLVEAMKRGINVRTSQGACPDDTPNIGGDR